MLSPRRLSARTVLVVDDQPADLAQLVALFSAWGWRVVAATDGEAALGLTARQPTPEIVVVAADMPGMDGFELLQRLREEAATAAVPVLMTLPAQDTPLAARAAEAGAAAWTAKPISESALLRLLNGPLAAALRPVPAIG